MSSTEGTILDNVVSTSMPKATDEVKRHRILHLFEKHQNVTKVARDLGLSPPTVRKWLRRFEQTGQVHCIRGTGRKSVITELVARQAIEMLLSGKYSGAQEVANELHGRGLTTEALPIHRTTLTRHAKSVSKSMGASIKAVQTAPQKELSAQNIAKRLQFCKRNLMRSWRNVMFTDRKKFYFLYPGVKVNKVAWIRVGQKRKMPKVNHAMCVNLYAGITPFGMTKPHLVAGTSKMNVDFKNKKGVKARNITAAEYEHVMDSTLLKEGARLFMAHGVSSWVFQQDNDPTHKIPSTKAITAWNKKGTGCRISLLPDWPPNSPDLSLIENVWAYVQHHVNRSGCKTFPQFKERVIMLVENLPKRVIDNLYRGMRSRLVECIEKNGDKTHY